MAPSSDVGRLPSVTVVTVCRNCRDMLAATMESVFAQDYPRMEYVVVDGASTDGSAELIESHADRIAWHVSEPDGGIYDAMNKGVAHASGDYIIFLNAGDLFADRGALGRLAIEADGFDIAYGDIRSGRAGEWSPVRHAAPPANCHRIWFCHQAALARRELLLRFPFDTRLRLSADFDFFKRCLLAGFGFRHVDTLVALFDNSGASNTGRLGGLRENLAIVRAHDSGLERLRFEAKLRFQIAMVRLRSFIRRRA